MAEAHKFNIFHSSKFCQLFCLLVKYWFLMVSEEFYWNERAQSVSTEAKKQHTALNLTLTEKFMWKGGFSSLSVLSLGNNA